MNNLTKTYNLLLALRENLPQEKYVGKKYVDEFHHFLNTLATDIGLNLDDYKIPESILEYTSGISRPGIGFQGFGEKQCERGFLLSKLDAVLLQFRPNEDKPVMGFRPLDK